MYSARLTAVLLGAGAGSRMGGGKIFLPWRGRPLICSAFDLVNSASFINKICILGFKPKETMEKISSYPDLIKGWDILINENWAQGQSSSLKLAVRHMIASDINKKKDRPDGVIFFLGDLPLIRHDTLSELIDKFSEFGGRGKNVLALAPSYQEKRGHPILFSTKLFPEMLKQEGDVGARKILEKLGDDFYTFPTDDAGVVFDLDTREDYDFLCKNYP